MDNLVLTMKQKHSNKGSVVKAQKVKKEEKENIADF